VEVLAVSALELHSPTISPSAGLGGFRLVDRRPRPNVRRRRRPVAHPFRAALVYTMLPALVLVFYVSLWTAAVHGGYQEQQLTTAIQRMRIDNQSLQADVRRLQSPTRIFHRAVELGMQEARQAEYVILPAPTAPKH
jgi:cell division protein FtsL